MNVLGIDIGGTSVKFGVVNASGEILEKKAFDTLPWMEGKGFITNLLETIDEYLSEKPDINSVGIGFPGLLSRNREEVLLLPNIPSVNRTNVKKAFNDMFPDKEVHLENDAKCAALGELIFNHDDKNNSFLMLTLGTGVGGALIIDRQLFLGANGNPAEVGHMLTHTGKTLEQQVGQRKIVNYALSLFERDNEKVDKENLSVKKLAEMAAKGNKNALATFEFVGALLGESLVNMIRCYDVNNFLFGGGVSGAHKYIFPSMEAKIKANLPSYYLNGMTIGLAKLKNEAGILGAAALALHQYDEVKNEVVS